MKVDEGRVDGVDDVVLSDDVRVKDEGQVGARHKATRPTGDDGDDDDGRVMWWWWVVCRCSVVYGWVPRHLGARVRRRWPGRCGRSSLDGGASADDERGGRRAWAAVSGRRRGQGGVLLGDQVGEGQGRGRMMHGPKPANGLVASGRVCCWRWCLAAAAAGRWGLLAD